MNPWRLLLYLVLLVTIGAAGYAAALAGITLCSPGALPGDELWTWRMRAGEALQATLAGQPRLCFLQSAFGAALINAGRWTTVALGVLTAAAILWETAGRRGRMTLLGRWGGHAILAGDERTLRRLSAQEARRGGIVHVAPDRDAARGLQRRRPFREVTVLEDRSQTRALLRRLGLRSARRVVAATGSDLTNLALCETALEASPTADLLLRLEQPSIRALGSHQLRKRAEAAGTHLTCLSLTQMRIRRGMALAMPGRYVDERAGRAHSVVCGSGFGMQEASFHVARQGYGLERAKPLLSLLRTGHRDFAAGTLDRLAAASDAVDLSLATADAGDILALERAITGIVLNNGEPCAVYCLGDHEGEALALARRWERALLDLGLPVPPIIAFDEADGQPGETGMIRVAARIDLAEASEQARTMDLRARLCHQYYLDGQKHVRGAEFGSLPAEVDWALLAEGYQDDNRNLADHIDYKLGLAGATTGPAGGHMGALAPDAVALLAPVEHARWVASKAVAGWRYGEDRHNGMLTHPDMKPYEELDEDAKRKDRQEVEALPALLALAGEGIVWEVPLAVILDADRHADGNLVCAHLARWQHAGKLPLVRLPLDGAGPLQLAEQLLAARVAIEIVQDEPVFAIFSETGDPALRRRAAAILSQASRIRIVEGRNAREAIAADGPVFIDRDGGIHDEAMV